MTLTGTAAGTLTIAPGSGTSDVVINMPSAGGTVTLAAGPTFAFQRAVLHVHNGATLGALAPNTGYVFSTSGGPSSMSLSAAGSIDRFALLAPDTSHWAVMAAATGFTD